MKLLSIFLFLFLLSFDSFGQIKVETGPRKVSSYAHPEKGAESIAMLREGTLIVRLTSFSQKIDYLEETAGTEKADHERERIELANKSIIKEFMEDYRFSDVVFSYGKELDQFLKNNIDDIFLNENLEFDTSIKLKDGPVFILATRSTSVFRLCDINFVPITDPSIEYVSHYMDSDYRGLNAFAQGFRELTRSSSAARKLNKRLAKHARNAY